MEDGNGGFEREIDTHHVGHLLVSLKDDRDRRSLHGIWKWKRGKDEWREEDMEEAIGREGGGDSGGKWGRERCKRWRKQLEEKIAERIEDGEE